MRIRHIDKCTEHFRLLAPLGNRVCMSHMRGSGGGGCRESGPEKSQNIGFLSNTCPYLLKTHKATESALNVGPPSGQ